MSNNFGGNWTIEKLNIFTEYFNLYLKALKNKKFKKIYIDAFAGTGGIKFKDEEYSIPGSSRIVLESNNKFDHYFFIEKDKKNYNELNKMIDEKFQEQRNIITTINEDANEALKGIIKKINWNYNRAILFIDPYATEFKWDTLKEVAKTGSIDVWYLFSYYAVNRMLTTNGEIDPSWKNKITSLFDSEDWEEQFYKKSDQISLFDEEPGVEKTANIEIVKQYLIKRLETIFCKVSPTPRVLYNNNKFPMFIFCFCVSNQSKKAQNLAMKFAKHVLEKPN